MSKFAQCFTHNEFLFVLTGLQDAHYLITPLLPVVTLCITDRQMHNKNRIGLVEYTQINRMGMVSGMVVKYAA